MNPKRILAIDATRGIAMFFALLAHFAEAYVDPADNFALQHWIYRFAKVASPTFFLISGIVLGYLHVTQSNEEFPSSRALLLGRALFLLTIGRVLIYVAHVPLAGGWLPAFGRSFITDAIATSIIIGTLTIRRIRIPYRILLAITCYVGAWILIDIWTPQSIVADLLKKFFVGSMEGYNSVIRVDFPLLPWFGVYLIGTVLGERIASYYMRNDEVGASQFVMRVATTALLGSVFFLILQRILPQIEPTFMDSPLYRQVYFAKLPPTIPYFLFYGSIGLSFLFVFMRFSTVAVVRSVARHASILGQTSLFAFIFQYFLYFTIFVLLDIPYSAYWPILFIFSAALVYIAAHIWYIRGWNVYLVIPYRRILTAVGVRKGSSLSRL